MNMTSNCDVTNTSNTNDHHMALNETTPMKIFCIRHCTEGNLKKICKMSTLPSLEGILRTPMCIIYIAEDIEFQSTKQQGILHFLNKNESQLPERVYPQGGHEASSSTSNVQFVKSVCADLLIVAGLTEELKTKRRMCQVVR